MSTGSNIKKYRKQAKLTQDELAKILGISKNGLWNYENEKRDINIELLHKIAQSLDVSVSDLLGIRKENINLLSDEFLRQSLKNYSSETTQKVVSIIDQLVLSPYDGILDIDVFDDDDIARFYLTTHIVLALQEYKNELEKLTYFSFSDVLKLKEVITDDIDPKKTIQLSESMIDHQKNLLDTKTDIHKAINTFEQWFLQKRESHGEDYSKDIIDKLVKHVEKYDRKRIDL